MADVTLSIDGREVKAPAGATVLEAAQQAGLYIPTLCAHPDLKPYGGCRMCITEIERLRGFPTACTTPVTAGMVVKTNTPQLQQLRRNILEFLLTEHPHPCITCHRIELCGPGDICLRHVSVSERCVTCPKNKRCELKEVARYIQLPEMTLPYSYRGLPIENKDPFYDRDYNLCILCGRCVRICDEVVGASALAFTYRGSKALVGTAFGRSLEEAGCIFCGSCIDICPTGSIVERANRWAGLADRQVVTTCPYCGVGCQLRLFIKDDKIQRVKGEPNAPANMGRLCVKGKFGLDFIQSPERLTTPLIKKDGQFVAATWEEALSLIAQKLAPYKGIDQFAAISSAKCTNEENYLMMKFARAVMGTNNVDHCARLCHSSSVTGLGAVFGSAAMTNTNQGMLQSACFLVIGSNTTATHPVIGMKVRQAVKGGAKLIVADPREIPLCRDASIWLRQRPGSDVALLTGLARAIVDQGLEDKAFIAERCEDYEAFKASLAAFDLDTVEKLTGVAKADIAAAARLYATTKPAAILYAMGITQSSHGTDNVMAVANLAMLTGNLGKPGAGVNPLRGQNNVQGSCDMGALPNVYAGYQSVADAALREKHEKAWGVSLPARPGLTLVEMFNAAYEGKIKAIYMMGENPMVSDPDIGHVEEALKKLEFFVCQDIFMNETNQFAHVILPATSFAEKGGTFTNTERRVQLVRPALPALGQARTDWEIICQLAQRLGGQGFDFAGPAQVMEEMARLTPSYGGISHARLEKEGGLQWPCPTADHPGTPILHTERFTRGKGKFTALTYRPPTELPDADYPLVLTTARSYYHYHTGTMTRKVKDLNRIVGEGMVEINPADATKLAIQDGDWVEVTSRRGQARARAAVTGATPPGVITMSFHFAEANANVLTNPALDPQAKIPEFKTCAVKVAKAAVKVPA
ncbi:MAG: formate dehydrogenase subunit alpha [Chloroflexi bacterium]|nr:formate dehydrogenase subunit alpha [Chloroflexota bacterium]